MAMFKCKMCGGELNVSDGTTVVECEYCGTKQTVPTSKDENLQGLFNRANILRMKSEFDKAEQIYEKIIQNDETQSEAYWGLILCKYGIEYVEDPTTFKRIPTCHRTSFESVTADEDYKSALSYAEPVQRDMYEAEAKEIDRLQKEILLLSEKEEPYDVFICYKETDNDGKRTQDSAIANEIYHQLTQEGLKVFYAAITLEDKLGREYEPYIFAALNSAKVMLVIGTKPEYFNAVWVKNEWSRYLKIIQKDRTKTLIPCYRDMDAYELPEEFAHLQAQDMSKIGFINDIVRGIKKVVGNEEKSAVAKETVAVGANTNTASLLERAFMFLEDGDFKSADEYCEKVLDIDPKCAKAYLGKLMAQLHAKKEEDLALCKINYENNNNYQKAIRFADDDLKNRLEEANRNTIYEIAKQKMDTAKTEKMLLEAAAEFDTISGYKNADELAKECRDKAHLAAAAEHEMITKRTKMNELTKNLISVGNGWTVGLKADGTVITVGSTYGQCEVSHWRNIVAISAGESHTVGLKADGTVVAVNDNKYGQCNVEEWNDIVSVSAGGYHTVGLKSDGTVVAVGDNKYGQCNVEEWNDIVSVSAGESHTVGLKADGTVVAIGYNDGQCNVMDWTDITAISAGLCYTVGVKADGTVVTVCDNKLKQYNVEEWNDIVSVSAGSFCTVGVKADGTVVAVGDNKYGQCNVEEWNDIVSVSAGSFCTVGVKADGTVVAVGNNRSGRCNVEEWNLFDNIDNIEEERKIKMADKEKEFERMIKQKELECFQKKLREEKKLKEQQEKQRIMAQYRNSNLCQHCGGIFKGIFTKTCTKCGKKKDY